MALVECEDCGKDVSTNAAACPNCGAPIEAQHNQTHKKGFIPYTDQEVSVMLSRKKKTSHLLHLVLSICTFGLWIFIWFIVALSNSMENNSIDKMIAKGKRI